MRIVAPLALLLILACGSGDVPVVVTVLAQRVVVTIFPSGATGATGATGGTEQLSASVSGSANGAVTWDLPGSATTGTIVSTGAANAMYTAPNTVATYGDAASSSNRQRVADWSKRRARSGVRWGAEEKTIGVAKIIR